jgi:hypothetical protein
MKSLAFASSLWNLALLPAIQVSVSHAQSTLSCLADSGLTTLPACNSLYSSIDSCFSDLPTQTQAVGCYCNQTLFNSYFE